jgi:hypothetical protein
MLILAAALPAVAIDTSNVLLWLDAANTNSYPGSGSSWYDLGSSGNDCTLGGSAVFGSALVGGEIRFNRSGSSYGTLNTTVDTYSHDKAAIMVWLRYDGPVSGQRHLFISSEAANHHYLQWHEGGQRIHYKTYNSTKGSGGEMFENVTSATGTWYHTSVTWDTTPGDVEIADFKLWLNDAVVDSDTFPKAKNVAPYVPLSRIGGISAATELNGYISHVAIYGMSNWSVSEAGLVEKNFNAGAFRHGYAGRGTANGNGALVTYGGARDDATANTMGWTATMASDQRITVNQLGAGTGTVAEAELDTARSDRTWTVNNVGEADVTYRFNTAELTSNGGSFPGADINRFNLVRRSPASAITSWTDSSSSNNHCTLAGATRATNLVGGAFSMGTNTADLADLQTDIHVYTEDALAYAFWTMAPTDGSGDDYLSKSEFQNRNSFFYDWGNDSITWSVYNGSSSYNHFRGLSGRIQPKSLDGQWHLVAMTWVADSPGAATGTARQYLDGANTVQVLSAAKPWVNTTSKIVSIGNNFQGIIAQSLVYGNFTATHTADQLMSAIYDATKERFGGGVNSGSLPTTGLRLNLDAGIYDISDTWEDVAGTTVADGSWLVAPATDNQPAEYGLRHTPPPGGTLIGIR